MVFKIQLFFFFFFRKNLIHFLDVHIFFFSKHNFSYHETSPHGREKMNLCKKKIKKRWILKTVHIKHLLKFSDFFNQVLLKNLFLDRINLSKKKTNCLSLDMYLLFIFQGLCQHNPEELYRREFVANQFLPSVFHTSDAKMTGFIKACKNKAYFDQDECPYSMSFSSNVYNILDGCGEKYFRLKYQHRI